jgi:hypothetical protein
MLLRLAFETASEGCAAEAAAHRLITHTALVKTMSFLISDLLIAKGSKIGR